MATAKKRDAVRSRRMVSKKELARTIKHGQQPYNPADYSQFSKQASRILYWLVLLTLSISNFLIFVVLVPIFFLLLYGHLLIIVSVVGLIFGLLFNFLIQDIEHLEPRHHAFAAVFIPAVSIVNIAILLGIMRNIHGSYWSLRNQITWASLLYVGFFAVPYVVGWLRRKYTLISSGKAAELSG
jgi:hypothetical protein